MKKLLVLLVLGFTFTAFAQFKDSGFQQNNIDDGIVAHSSASSLFGFINPQNFSMKQSYSMSYSTFGGQGMALGVYTNSMAYKFNDKLNVQLEASFVNSPYSTLGKNFQNSINGVYINRAAINYQPWKDFQISVQYSNLPYSYYSPYSGYYGGLGSMGPLGYSNSFLGR